MKTVLWIALPCLLGAEPPLTLDDVLAKSKISISRLDADAALAEGRRQLKDASGFMREPPSLTVSAGPRTSSTAPSATDQTIEIDAPLMLNRGAVRKLAASLDSAAPAVYGAADLENRLAIQQAFFDAWAAERIEAVRAEDHSQVRAWLEIAQVRSESGADPAFQLELVKGEFLKARLDWEDSKRARLQAWNALRALSDLPDSPQPLDCGQGGAAYGIGGQDRAELEKQYRNGAMRRAAIARQDVELSQIGLQAALSNSRWSLSGSYAKESDDRIAKFGLAYRFPRSGEGSAIRAEQRAKAEAAKRNAELDIAGLDLRFAAAVQTIESSMDYPDMPDTAASLEALTLRLKEGKDRPSDAIPMRRQFLEIRITEMQRLHSLYIANAELLTLTAGNTP